MLQSCSHTDSEGSAGDAGNCKPVLEAQMDNILSGVDTDTDFTLYLETEAGQNYTFNYGNSTITTTYESASTSKWVTATIILRLVDEGILSLNDRPQDLIENWPIDSSDPLYDITLADLLSFTSGLTQEPLCINLAGANFEACVNQIGATNAGNEIIPGTQFYYSGTHMQVAGLMAVKAAGVDSWQDLFEMFQLQTGLFPNGAYDLPSAANPRLAGGMHWRGDEYADFIRAFIQGDLFQNRLKLPDSGVHWNHGNGILALFTISLIIKKRF